MLANAGMADESLFTSWLFAYDSKKRTERRKNAKENKM